MVSWYGEVAVSMGRSRVSQSLLVLHPADNVGVAAHGLKEGSPLGLDPPEAQIQARQKIPPGHKVAIRPVAAGEPVLKFGQCIGLAIQNVAPGDWVHVHNVRADGLNSANRSAPLGMEPERLRTPPLAPGAPRLQTPENVGFWGYRRADGRTGTRNYVAVISNVNCSASVSKWVARKFGPTELSGYPNVDGVLAFTHTGGCAMEYGGESHRMLARVLAGYAKHANIAAYLLIGLGCETGTIGYLLEQHGLVQLRSPLENTRETQSVSQQAFQALDKGAPPVLSIQDCGGTAATVDAACQVVRQLLPLANLCKREWTPVSQLLLGTNCGGSDGYSGITANPALGIASDLLVQAGGVSVLAETTEIYGAEQLLVQRARSPQVAAKLMERIHWWEKYTAMFGCTPDNNPSPGNKEGGLSTILEKSLGAVMKGGTSPLNAVYEYAEPISEKGFVFMDTPGFDPTSVTGLVAGGCNVIAFTTGRGSCFGCKPAPSVKIASNSPLYEKMPDDMDINAGKILQDSSLEELGQEIFHRIVSTASGEKTKSELLGLGEEEFSPWNIGPVL